MSEGNIEMKISLIVAIAENGVIGAGNALPWHLPGDMKIFREKTMGHMVLMGRKNFDSLPEKYKPLPGRTNLVLSRNKDFFAGSVLVFSAIPDALQFAKDQGEEELFIIGGAEIFKQCFPVVNTMYMTTVHAQPNGDVHFPDWNQDDWLPLEELHLPADEKNQFSFTFRKLVRKRNN